MTKCSKEIFNKRRGTQRGTIQALSGHTKNAERSSKTGDKLWLPTNIHLILIRKEKASG